MRILLQQQLFSPPLLSPLGIVPVVEDGARSWMSGCHGIWHNLALIIPSVLFIVFLASQARKSLTRLSYGRSYIIIVYYALLWVVSLLNLAWCFLQAWQCTPGRETSWNILSLFTASGMLFLEVSLIAFLLQGNQANGVEALTRVFVVSGVAVCVDILLKAIYVFGFGVPLFLDTSGSTHRVKWGLWVVHRLLLAAVYGFILYMYNSKWRERLPARPAFYNYIVTMLLLNCVTLFACILMGNELAFGFWIYNLTIICYHSLYPPFLYVTFLADFFQEEDLYLENIYYSEMRDAGFFDGEWD
ncbi:Protein of unknown function, transmembrane-40 [Zostera marina]|uniref:Transmembrane protein adipocyte-associated 1 n=1 Tax=Zostera marina TaxID=29655 RepID=A0A0K9NX54_ZOSMR|nr:Protein of unknown function, transmembrane-40 [Zostera marina]